MSVLCVNVFRVCMPNIMTELKCVFKTLHLVQVGTFVWYSVIIRIISGVRFERWEVDKSKPTWKLKYACKLYYSVLNVSAECHKSRSFNIEMHHFNVGAFYPRDAMLARVIAIATCLSVCPSVCLSVCPSRAGIVSKRRKLAAWFLHHLVAPRL